MIKLKAEVHFTGMPKWVGKMELNVFEDWYVDLYNKACELVNPHFEEWNNEFNNRYPGHIMPETGDDLYNSFICDKCNDQIRRLNTHPVIKLIYDPNYGCTCTGSLRMYPESRIYITITQIE